MYTEDGSNPKLLISRRIINNPTTFCVINNKYLYVINLIQYHGTIFVPQPQNSLKLAKIP